MTLLTGVNGTTRITTSKTKELVVNFQRWTPQITPVNTQGLVKEMVAKYKSLGVHLNNELDWTDNMDTLYKKGESCSNWLRKIRSFGVQRTFLRTFHYTFVASLLLNAVVFWGGSSTDKDRKRLN